MQRAWLTQLVLVAIVSTAVAVGQTAVPPETKTKEPQVTLNFKGVPLDKVLDYLSKEAGFVIVRKATVTGTVDVVSHQPLNRAEIVELLNVVLAENGLTAIHNKRILKIIKTEDARTADIPVRTGSDPEAVAKSDAIITQVIPMRHAKASEVMANLKQLLSETAVITSNKTSNAILLTDTQTNVRRMMSVIRAMDTTISSTTLVKVFPLVNGDAKSVADVINKTFADKKAESSGNSMSSKISRRMAMFTGGGSSKSEDKGGGTLSVTANSEERSNSVIVNAPKDVMDHVTLLINQLDVPTKDAAKVEVFPLKFADAEETAAKIIELFSTTNQSSSSGNSRGGFFSMMRGRSSNNKKKATTTGGRQLQAAEVNAVADVRTNSIIVTASEDTLTLVREVVGKLDATPEKIPQVYVYNVRNADLEKVKEILENMFEDFEESKTATRSGSTGSTGTGMSGQRSGNTNNRGRQ